jgi:hypothetical protein
MRLPCQGRGRSCPSRAAHRARLAGRDENRRAAGGRGPPSRCSPGEELCPPGGRAALPGGRRPSRPRGTSLRPLVLCWLPPRRAVRPGPVPLPHPMWASCPARLAPDRPPRGHATSRGRGSAGRRQGGARRPVRSPSTRRDRHLSALVDRSPEARWQPSSCRRADRARRASRSRRTRGHETGRRSPRPQGQWRAPRPGTS